MPVAPAPERFYREAALSLVPSDGAAAPEMEIAISSEHAVERVDFFSGERFLEVLDHSSGAVDLSRAVDGLPILLDHDPEKMVGVFEGARVDSDRVIRGMPKYSRSQSGRDVQMDVEDGIRKKVSAGYVVRQWDKKPSATRGGLPVWRAVNWMPVEMSHVAIPADPTVGVGRSAVVAAPAVHTHQTAPKAEERPVSEDNTAANGQAVQFNNSATGTTGRAEWVETPEQRQNREAVVRAVANNERMKDVATLAEMHNLESVFLAGVREGNDADVIQREMVRAIKARLKDEPPVNSAIVELTPKEQKKYSLSRAILSAADNKPSFEADVSEQIASTIAREGILNAGRAAGNAHAFYMPTNTRAGLYNAATVGAEVLFDIPGDFTTLLRNKMRVGQLGARYIGGLRDNLTFPEETAAGTAAWMAENPGSDASDSNLTLTTKSLSPKTLNSNTSFSRQLLRQANANFDIEQIVREDLATIHALAIDLACLTGGASNSPQGLFSNTSVQVYSFATNGAAPTYTNMVGHIFSIENSNANVSVTGFLTTPGIKATLMVTQKFPTTNGEAVWIGGEEGTVAGYRAYSSNQVQKNLTAGTSTTIAHAIYYGCWDQIYIGEWGAMEIIVDPFRLKKQGMIELSTFQMIGLLVRRPLSFVISKQSLSAF